jgi:hypothetical protein
MLALPAACRRDPPLDSVPSTQVSVASAPSASSASPSASAAAPPSASVTPASEPSGEATLVIQRVESDCGTGPTGRNLLGYDVLLSTHSDDEAKTPPAKQLSCPPGRRNMWEMCKRYARCTVDVDAGNDRIVVTCDKETITLESAPAGTRVTAPGVSLEVAPGPMRLLPVKRTLRYALVDC